MLISCCGHVTCFWCCHRAMDMRGQSHRPLCRHPFRHLPAICRMLDIFLKNTYPVSYGTRKKQALEDDHQSLLDCLVNDEEDHPSVVNGPSDLVSEDNMLTNPSSTDENKSKGGRSAGNCKQVTNADMQCAACKQLLFRPVVLNCGHVYCEACVTIAEEGVIKCQVCQCRHPSGFPKVCKELVYVLEEQFPADYALRQSTTLSQEQIQSGNLLDANDQGLTFSYPREDNFLQWWTVNGSKFHPRVGCDMCGMSPIVGERYKCNVCMGRGYDLCGECYNSGLTLPGRFNQKHTPQHQLELIKPVINRDVIYRLLSGQLALVSAASRSRDPANGRSELASSSVDDDNAGDNDDDSNDEDDNDSHGVGVVSTESANDLRDQNQDQTAM